MSQVLVEVHQQKDVAWELRLVTRAGQAMRTCGSGKIAGYNSFVCWWRVGADIVSWMSWTMIMRVTKPEPYEKRLSMPVMEAKAMARVRFQR